MAAKELYILPTRHAAAQAGAMQEDGAAPATAALSPPTGWVVGTTGSARFSSVIAGSERAASSFGADPLPENITIDFPDRGYLSPAPLTGIIPAGSALTFSAAFRNGNGGGNSADGNCRSRLVAVSDTAFGAARDLTGILVSQQINNISSVTQTTVATLTVPANIVLQNEYLYWQFAWRIGGAATSGDDINVVGGPSKVAFELNPLPAPAGADLVGMVCG